MPPQDLDKDDLDTGPENTLQANAPTADPSLERTTDRRIVPDDHDPAAGPLPPRNSQFGNISTPTAFTPQSRPPSPAAAPVSGPPSTRPQAANAPSGARPSGSMRARTQSSPTSIVAQPNAQQPPVPQPMPARSSVGPMPARSQPPQSVRSPAASPASVPPVRSVTEPPPQTGYSSHARVPAGPPSPPSSGPPPQSPRQGQGQTSPPPPPPLPSQGSQPKQQQQVYPQDYPQESYARENVAMPQVPSGASPMGTLQGGFSSPASAMMGAPPPMIAPQPMSQSMQQGMQQHGLGLQTQGMQGQGNQGQGNQGMTGFGPPPSPSQAPQQGQQQSLALRGDVPRDLRAAAFHVRRSRAYSFVLDQRGLPIELGSGRFAKAYLGEERWLESKTDFRREVVIKILQKGVDPDDHMRFQMEQELLERVQGHPNIVELMASGEGEDIQFIPQSIRDKVDPEFMILERLEMSLEERLKGSRHRAHKDDLLACDMRERIFRTLDYMIPLASAIEYAHLVKNICHRDLKPANVLIKLPDPNLRGSTLEVRLADFNVAKLSDQDVQMGMTQQRGPVPGTLFFQSPEQETNIIELLVNVQNGVPEVEYFEDFYIQISKNDSFSLWNRDESYPVLYADRTRKRVVLGRPYRDVTETNVRARIQKSVGRPADIYSLGAVLYYLISGAYSNPKTLYDAFHKFVEYEKTDENNTIESYLMHEYNVINSLRAPKTESQGVAPADRFFTYKHYLDGNGELIDPNVLLIVAKCMIRNKPDSYCQAHDLETRGISELVQDLINLYALYGVHPAARPTHLARRAPVRKGALTMGLSRMTDRMRLFFRRLFYRTR